jgi:hypothetical protein
VPRALTAQGPRDLVLVELEVGGRWRVRSDLGPVVVVRQAAHHQRDDREDKRENGKQRQRPQ